MNKIIIGIGIVAVVLLGWFLIQGSTVSYVSTIHDEVALLEEELAIIEADVEAGRLTPEQATVARASIAARLDTINNAVTASQSAKLTAEQQATLSSGLDRLKAVLIAYRGTLTVVEETAVDKPQLNRGGGKRTITSVLEDTIAVVADRAEDVVDDYVPEDDPVASDEATEDDDMSDSDPTGDESGTPDDEETDGIEIEAEAELDAEAEAVTEDDPDATTTN